MENATEEVLALRRIHRLQQTGMLVELREADGLTQADVARWVGVDPSQVSRWESGDFRPRARHAVRLLKLLDGEE
jgi:DNA-binding transcriptional regulator YiaG